ncbi:MAG: hypothetical protein NT056_05815, partial [Proteobacteria bacterium]|nr:hypothetical protein [Pseudomonadota bacterium]
MIAAAGRLADHHHPVLARGFVPIAYQHPDRYRTSDLLRPGREDKIRSGTGKSLVHIPVKNHFVPVGILRGDGKNRFLSGVKGNHFGGRGKLGQSRGPVTGSRDFGGDDRDIRGIGPGVRYFQLQVISSGQVRNEVSDRLVPFEQEGPAEIRLIQQGPAVGKVRGTRWVGGAPAVQEHLLPHRDDLVGPRHRRGFDRLRDFRGPGRPLPPAAGSRPETETEKEYPKPKRRKMSFPHSHFWQIHTPVIASPDWKSGRGNLYFDGRKFVGLLR